MLILGFEVADILIIFFLLSILNLLFGTTHHKIPLIWCPVLAVALTLRLGKRGKPDDYLLHRVRYQIQPKFLSAFEDPRIDAPLRAPLKQKWGVA